MAPKMRAKAKAKGTVKAKAKASAGGGGRKLPKSAGSVSPQSGLVGKGKVFKDGSDLFDIDLNVRDEAKNMNKFYRMQVVQSNDGSKYWFVQHWGRVGTGGQVQVKGPMGKDAAVKAIKSKFRQKSGKAWENRGSAGPGSGDSAARGGHGHYELTSRLKSAGTKFSKLQGSVQISLMWDHSSKKVRNDLDLHVVPPGGEKIWYEHKRSKCGGQLDVDRRMDADRPVENIVWTKKAPRGTYKVSVQNFMGSHSKAVSFEVGISKDGGEMQMFKKTVPGRTGTGRPAKAVTTFTYP